MYSHPISNPWGALPLDGPYILGDDASLVDNHNNKAQPNKRYDLSLLPEPYFGSPLAPVILLALNPGHGVGDAELHSQGWFKKMARESLMHQLWPYPFLHLQPQSATDGGLWWQRITKELISTVGFDLVSKGIFCVEYFPYHSIEFGSPGLQVPSQQYSFELVRAGLRRGAEVVLMRSSRLWLSAIPELIDYPFLHKIKNPRNPTLSSKNLANGHSVLINRLMNNS